MTDERITGNRFLFSKKAQLLGVLCALSCSVLASSPARADRYFDYGATLLKQRKFRESIKYFDQRLRLVPNDPQALYFKAVALHHSGDREGAKALYQTIEGQFSGSRYSALAAANLAKMTDDSEGGATGSKAKTFRDETSDEDDEEALTSSKIPEMERVYFTDSGHNDIIVEAKINGRRLSMCFDTGAHGILLGTSHLQQLGLRIPKDAVPTMVAGVGGVSKGYEMDVDVSLGSISKKLPVTVSESWTSKPLLGQDFFGDMEYEFDHKAHCICFRRSKSRDVSSDLYAVPFRRSGRHLLVDVEVKGGRKTTMIVDTGAEGIAFTETNLRQLGLSVPDDARKMKHVGVGGSSDGYTFSIEELRLGPIIQRSPTVSVMLGNESFMGSEGLLGMEFFRSWRYTIDNKNQCLRFFH